MRVHHDGDVAADVGVRHEPDGEVEEFFHEQGPEEVVFS